MQKRIFSIFILPLLLFCFYCNEDELTDISSPVFSVEGGIYDDPQEVEITCDSPDVIIRYTIDKSIPSSTNGIIYESPVLIESTLTLQAIAYCDTCNDSVITSADYTIRANSLMLTIRDFTPETNPDFEDGVNGLETGLIENNLGEDGTPVLINPEPNTTTIHSEESFYQWYHDIEGVNIKINKSITLSEDGDNYIYENSSYFPIDGEGFGDYQSFGHNFHFTVKIQTYFLYNGSEVFTLSGDDDIWMFINGKLMIDIGGVHPVASGSVTIDSIIAEELGLESGNLYPADIFTAERHTISSNFNFSTNAFITNIVE